MPKKLRVGPWSKHSLPTLVLLTLVICYYCPTGDQLDTQVSSYPVAFSSYWWYNVLAFSFMSGMISWTILRSSIGIMVAFTILSWNMNTVRHGINVLAPFLYDHHVLLKLNHVLRFPALVSASLTFVVWNAVLFPYTYFFVLDTKEKKDNFCAWNFNVRMVQLHCCNIVYSVMNTMVTGTRDGMPPQLFDDEDLWYGLAYSLVYGLFYTLILDRVGIHLYPIFSPRSNFVVVTWLLVFSLHYAAYLFWNYIMRNHWDVIQFNGLIAFNFVVIGTGATIYWALSKKLPVQKNH